MTAAKKRDLVEEICEGLKAYRDRRHTLRRREFSAPDVKALWKQYGISQFELAGNALKATIRGRLG